ncbi:MAG: hypothetical protein LBC18_13085 [Opitutaceae bacterium]|nr:hypothetical protein [Opitutaceae bacterium]
MPAGILVTLYTGKFHFLFMIVLGALGECFKLLTSPSRRFKTQALAWGMSAIISTLIFIFSIIHATSNYWARDSFSRAVDVFAPVLFFGITTYLWSGFYKLLSRDAATRQSPIVHRKPPIENLKSKTEKP